MLITVGLQLFLALQALFRRAKILENSEIKGSTSSWYTMAKRATLPFQIGVNGGYSKNEVVYYVMNLLQTLPWQSITGRPFSIHQCFY